MDKEQNSAEELLKIYNLIDAFLRQSHGADKNADHSYLIQHVAKTNHLVARHEPQMRAIAHLRNVIVHNPASDTISPIAYPHPKLIEDYRAIHKSLLHPQTALSIAVPGHVIYTANLKTPLSKVLKAMDKHTYTHVPIIEDHKMVGIFSENTLLSYLADSGETIILNDMTMADFKNYLPLGAHKGESFAFLPRRAELKDAYDIFAEAIKVRERIGMIFITQNGNTTEKPLGIITAWDLSAPGR